MSRPLASLIWTRSNRKLVGAHAVVRRRRARQLKYRCRCTLTRLPRVAAEPAPTMDLRGWRFAYGWGGIPKCAVCGVSASAPNLSGSWRRPCRASCAQKFGYSWIASSASENASRDGVPGVCTGIDATGVRFAGPGRSRSHLALRRRPGQLPAHLLQRCRQRPTLGGRTVPERSRLARQHRHVTLGI